MHIYTGIGDDGTSNLYGANERLTKDSVIYHALGDVDELNTYIGLCRAKLQVSKKKNIDKERFLSIVHQMQECLFIIQAELAGAEKVLTKKHMDTIESDIAYVLEYMEIPQTFIISGTTVLSAHFDVARTIARRAERSIVAAHGVHPVTEYTLAYINRSSSLLYALARSMVDENTQSELIPTYT